MKVRKLWLSAAIAFSAAVMAQEKAAKIAYSQIIAHPALDEIYAGMVQGLQEHGYVVGKNLHIDYQIAQGDMAINNQIAQKFVGDKPDVIVASTTPSAQAVIAAAKGRLPIVFTGITDPISAKLVDNLEKPGGNVTGVKEALAYEQNVAILHSLLPEAKHIGTVFNPGEDNSNASNAMLEKTMQPRGLTLVSAPAKNTGEVLDAARSLVGKVDAFLITLDNTAVSGLPSLVQVAEQHKLPLFVFDTYSVPIGAAVGVGYDEFDVGRLTADKVAAILQGAKAGDLPVAEVEKSRIVLNPAAAARQGLTLPQNLLDQASEIVEEKK